MFVVIYLIAFFIFLGAPWYLQILFTIVNFFIPDPIPVIDEALMAASLIKKLLTALNILDFVEEHPVLSLAIAVAAIGGIIAIVLAII